MVRFDRWDVDYKPEPNDTTGPNILLKALPRLSFLDTSTGLLVSKSKVPKDLKAFAKLNKPSQSHLIHVRGTAESRAPPDEVWRI